ncbi:DinB family protein [Paenibacillus sp. 481]|uniref:DinB family protein n=1 Tax=Paenibacillus sp. 481 TaxID=2835869 RepID=UPI001E4A6803|nr:DinB family protein [Paenibacillus sp. 481]UHA74854.1 DinB family protein [Paenibacillus sp. 481]
MELQDLIQPLHETRNELLEILHGLNEAQLHKRKEPTGWNVSQVFQHLFIVEQLYVAAIGRGLMSKEDSSVDSKPIQDLLDRSKKFAAPDIAQPTDELWGIDEIVDKLSESRKKLYALLNALPDPSVLSRRHFIHPAFQELSLMEWVRSLYIHEQRHAEQIRDILNG